MENLVWFIIMIPCSLFFSILGIYAWNKKTPIWFWSGTRISENEIRDIKAYNRENGKMWIGFSLVLWFGTMVYIISPMISVIVIIAGNVIGIPILIFCYDRIYKKYKI